MLTIIVIAKNESERLAACLQSCSFADELIVWDNDSTDDTVKIAKKYTQKVFHSSGQDFSTVRNKAMQEAKGEWVFYVDADERVTQKLRQEILDIVQRDDASAYALSRRNIIFGQEVNYGPYAKDWVTRLLRKKDFKRWVGKVHEYPQFDGDLKYTENSLIHLTHRDIDHIVLKSLEWSHIDAKLRLDANHPPMTSWRFLRILLTETFNQGIKRRGFWGGTIGVMDSMLQVFSLFITYVRLWQLQQPKSIDETYRKIDEELLKSDFPNNSST